MLVERASAHGDRVAIVDAGNRFAYRDLLERSAAIAAALRATLRGEPQPRIAYLLPAGFEHVATQWGIWRAGAIAVPLAASQAAPEWTYILEDTQASAVMIEPGAADRLRPPAGCQVLFPARNLREIAPGAIFSGAKHDGALILYTSGTTGKPKGVVMTHANLEAQARCLVDAWQWSATDRILHVLPLNHVHGIVNALACALWCGATCDMLPKFEAQTTWEAIAAGRATVFMAVPTIYTRLIAAWEQAGPERQRAWSEAARRLRLMVSGSAALPVSVLERWRDITGHVLLERYGMTEIGMALSNPLSGERRPGSVGTPLPGVEVRIVDEQGAAVRAGDPGELEVRGPAVFREYWRRPDATAAAFRDGWFRTGDVAVVERGMYRLLGRQSVDIIKSGGEKISALEIEEVLREHPSIAECAVVGLDDPEWGERIAVAIVARDAVALELETLRDWARPRLARYKLPTRLLVLQELPRNAMGKVSKPAVKQLFLQRGPSGPRHMP